MNNKANQSNPFQDQANSLKKLSGIVKIGVHSGKGGVGKTFVAVNLAYSLAAAGYKVGLLDADIDCPNVPKFLSVSSVAARSATTITPVTHNGVKLVSTALLNQPSESPIIIRGPIKHNMLVSFLTAVEWGTLDYLIIDLPPGTADVPLSAMQLSALDGIIFVTTPTKEALLDTARACNMARQLGLKLVGLVENMSGEIFGSNGADSASRLGLELICSIPLSAATARINERAGIAFIENGELKGQRDALVAKLIRIR